MILVKIFLCLVCLARTLYSTANDIQKNRKIIFFVPPNGFNGDSFFNPNARDGCAMPFIKLKKSLLSKNYILTSDNELIKKAEYALFMNIPRNVYQLKSKIRGLPKSSKLICIQMEPVVVKPWFYDKKLQNKFWRILTLEDKLVDNKKFFKYHYPQPSLSMLDNIPMFEQRKLLTLVSSNRRSTHPLQQYSKRLSVINFFENFKNDDFDFYGQGWHKIKPTLNHYRGAINNKSIVIQNYRFGICYENTKYVKGYVTEKIFDYMIAGCIPIYIGAPNIKQYVDRGCFIDGSRFVSNKELYEFLKKISRERYEQYLCEIKKYLESPKAKLFSIENFINSFFNMLESAEG